MCEPIDRGVRDRATLSDREQNESGPHKGKQGKKGGGAPLTDVTKEGVGMPTAQGANL